MSKNGNLRSRTMFHNGKELVLGKNDELPEMTGEKTSGKNELSLGGCAFILL